MPWNRNLAVLFTGHATLGSCAAVMVLLNGFVGAELAPSASFATLAMGIMVVGTALGSMGAARLMGRWGRRKGFQFGAALGALGALLAALAIYSESFTGFCVSAVFLGLAMAFVQTFRFAAAECVPTADVSKAIAIVLLGGIASALIGPRLALMAKDWVGAQFTGSYLVLAGLCCIGWMVLSRFQDQKILIRTREEGSEGSSVYYKDPTFYAAVIFATTGFGVMSFIMTATPLHMHHSHGFSLEDATLVIQSHIIAMFLPSLISGWLIARLGVSTVVFLGIVCNVCCVVITIESSSLLAYWGGLALLGVGWNFLFVGGTTLLANKYRGEERFKIQSINDFSVFSVQAMASLGAGFVLHAQGWMALNQIALAALSVCLLVLIVNAANNRSAMIRAEEV